MLAVCTCKNAHKKRDAVCVSENSVQCEVELRAVCTEDCADFAIVKQNACCFMLELEMKTVHTE